MDCIQQAVDFVTAQRNNHHDLHHFCQFLQSQGNPQNQLQVIHVAGTNGKGSTVSYLASCLTEAGCRVGTFTSPHLVAHQDRIRIQESWIDDATFLRYTQQYQKEIETWQLGMFEIDFFFACLWFVEQQVDFAIIEVGIGGRDDKTNALATSVVSVIVNIGLDHMDRLGNSLQEIAYAKAGIVKEKGLLVTTENKQECLAVFSQECEKKQADFIVGNKSSIIQTNPLQFSYQGQLFDLESQALYQVENASLALLVLEQLKLRGKIQISLDQIQRGIKKAKWEGRYELISKKPRIILDGAHNQPGILALCQSAKNLPEPHVILFSALKDKAYHDMALQLLTIANRLIVTQFSYGRAQNAKQLQVEGSEVIADWKLALEEGINAVEDKGSLLVCGSLYFISEVRSYLLKNKQ